MVCIAAIRSRPLTHNEVSLGQAKDRSVTLVFSFWEIENKSQEFLAPAIPHKEIRVLSGKGLCIRYLLGPVLHPLSLDTVCSLGFD